jgi:hypothetical protein
MGCVLKLKTFSVEKVPMLNMHCMNVPKSAQVRRLYPGCMHQAQCYRHHRSRFCYLHVVIVVIIIVVGIGMWVMGVK